MDNLNFTEEDNKAVLKGQDLFFHKNPEQLLQERFLSPELE